MTLLIDTSVIMYAGGAAHPHREACRAVLQQVADGHLDAVVSTEVVQEILHRFSRGDRDIGVRMARSVLDLFGTLVPVDRAVMADATVRFRSAAELSARDALHAATCAVHGLEAIVSVDTDFDGLPDVRRVPPEALDQRH
ncbi:MAG: type II toxin-antitoxin system VapC family toxin [Nitriliruptor sp.]|uniref:type II toxin-antitoxin system VapC family toxin n=1 Tax=Nitriliruptor sp. TaxID=2448056 RepID=UPI00349FF1C3